MGEFEVADFAGYVGGGVGGGYVDCGLEDDGAVVVVVVDMVDGYACLAFAGGNNSLVDAVAVHALASEFWQQRWVDVDDAASVTLDQGGRYHKQESGESNEINGVAVK